MTSRRNLERYYDTTMVKDILRMYPLPLQKEEDIQRFYGDVFSDWQVYLPVRILARDLLNSGYPVLRYQIQWVPEQCKTDGMSWYHCSVRVANPFSQVISHTVLIGCIGRFASRCCTEKRTLRSLGNGWIQCLVRSMRCKMKGKARVEPRKCWL